MVKIEKPWAQRQKERKRGSGREGERGSGRERGTETERVRIHKDKPTSRYSQIEKGERDRERDGTMKENESQ